MSSDWTAREIAKAVASQVFNYTALVVVPNCTWTGNETDLLVVRKDLRLVDIEIKISRADLKRDDDKDKWLNRRSWYQRQIAPEILEQRRDWPERIWKHYFCCPRDIWRPELAAFLPTKSGIIAISDGRATPQLQIVRQARANPAAIPITLSELVDVARLANLRMWKSFEELDRSKRAASVLTTARRQPLPSNSSIHQQPTRPSRQFSL